MPDYKDLSREQLLHEIEKKEASRNKLKTRLVSGCRLNRLASYVLVNTLTSVPVLAVRDSRCSQAG